MKIYKIASDIFFTVSVHEGEDPIRPEHGIQEGWIRVADDVEQFALRELIKQLMDEGYTRESILVQRQKHIKTKSNNGLSKIYSIKKKKEEKLPEFKSVEDVLYNVDDQKASLLQEFYDKKRKQKSMMSWDVVPFARLKKIWQDYVIYGFIRDVDGINYIATKMLANLARLQAATDLSGHSRDNPDDIAEELGYKPMGEQNDDFYWHFLETQYGTPVSDYGLTPLWKLGQQLVEETVPERKLLIIDQMLNIVHQRGDLAALFIEGGKFSLSQLSSIQ